MSKNADFRVANLILTLAVLLAGLQFSPAQTAAPVADLPNFRSNEFIRAASFILPDSADFGG